MVSGVNCSIFLTHLDMAYDHIKRDTRQIFMEQRCADMVESISGELGVSKDDVMPLVNYVPHNKIRENRSIVSKCTVKALLMI